MKLTVTETTFTDETGFANPNITREFGVHRQDRTGEWQATISSPPLGKWEVWCDAYKISQGNLEVAFPGVTTKPPIPVTGVDPATPVRFTFRINKMADEVEPA